jgi:hypothetical protein
MTSVEYLLTLKKNVENQIIFFENQESFLKEISHFSFDNENENKLTANFMEENSLEYFFSDISVDKERENAFDFLKERIAELYSIKQKIEDQLYKICDHSFMKDYIDTFPERSQMIQYCSKCWCNYRSIPM